MKIFTYRVDNMRCEGCAKKISELLIGLNPAYKLTFNVPIKQFSIETDIKDKEILEKTLIDSGYKIELISNSLKNDKQDNLTISKNIHQEPQKYIFKTQNMSCSSCVAKVEKALNPIVGVKTVAVDLLNKQIIVSGGDKAEITKAIDNLGYLATQQLEDKQPENYNIAIDSMTCSSCVAKVETILLGINGVDKAMVNLIEKNAIVTGNAHIADILMTLDKAGYPSSLIQQSTEESLQKRKKETENEIRKSWNKAIVAAIVGLGIALPLMLSSWWQLFPDLATKSKGIVDINPHVFWILMLVIVTVTMYYSGRQYYKGAWQQLKHKSSNMDTLVAMGTGAAWIYSAVVIIFSNYVPISMLNLYLDTAVLILAFLNFGHALETKAKGKTSEAIQKLIEMQPKQARLVRDGIEMDIPVAMLKKGDLVRILPGEKIAVDALILEGGTNIDEAMLTGESMPVSKQKGDKVLAGTINQTGSLLVKVEVLESETALAKIVDMVKVAQISKPPIGKLVDKVTSIFVPIVLIIAIITFISWSFISIPHAITAAIAVLVIACPCALGLGTPIAMMLGTGKSAEYGILIRNGEALQATSELTDIVLDKTGTVTEGKPKITKVIPLNGYDENTLIAWVYSLEKNSEHPLALAITDYAKVHDISAKKSTDFQALIGYGVTGKVLGHNLLIGNQKLLVKHNIDMTEYQKQVNDYASTGVTPVLVGVDNSFAGILILEDQIKQDSVLAIEEMQRMGLKVAMITGDNKLTADAVAKTVNIKTVFSEVLPEDKSNFILKLQNKGGKVAMVGDGINDAPALTQANVGFAIGSGSDIAIESADISLASGSLSGVKDAIFISRTIMRNIKQTLFGAFIYNAAGIPIAAGVLYPIFGILLSPIIASAAMALSSVTVVLSASRLRRLKPSK